MSRGIRSLVASAGVALAAFMAAPFARADDNNAKEGPLVVGASDDGGLGAKLKLRRAETLARWEFGEPATGTLYWGATADGVWSSKEDAKNQVELGAELGCVTGIRTFESKSEHFLTLAFVFKGRRGEFEEDDQQVVRHDEYLYGPKLIYRFSWEKFNTFLSDYAGDLGERPAIVIGYYRVGGETAELADLPERLTADEIYGQFRLDVPAIPLTKKDVEPARAVLISLLAQATRPLEGEDRSWTKFIDATLSLNTGSKWRPAISFQSGEKDGFKYDRQILLGLLWELFGNK